MERFEAGRVAADKIGSNLEMPHREGVDGLGREELTDEWPHLSD